MKKERRRIIIDFEVLSKGNFRMCCMKDYKSEAENQEKSLIYYENTYLQNSGVSYGREASFDVVLELVKIIEEKNGR